VKLRLVLIAGILAFTPMAAEAELALTEPCAQVASPGADATPLAHKVARGNTAYDWRRCGFDDEGAEVTYLAIAPPRRHPDRACIYEVRSIGGRVITENHRFMGPILKSGACPALTSDFDIPWHPGVIAVDENITPQTARKILRLLNGDADDIRLVRNWLFGAWKVYQVNDVDTHVKVRSLFGWLTIAEVRQYMI